MAQKKPTRKPLARKQMKKTKGGLLGGGAVSGGSDGGGSIDPTASPAVGNPAREAGSGMASGRRQYKPLTFTPDNNPGVAEPPV